jgi:hypothetical protein
VFCANGFKITRMTRQSEPSYSAHRIAWLGDRTPPRATVYRTVFTVYRRFRRCGFLDESSTWLISSRYRF